MQINPAEKWLARKCLDCAQANPGGAQKPNDLIDAFENPVIFDFVNQ